MSEHKASTSQTKKRRINQEEQQTNELVKETQDKHNIENLDSVNLQSQDAIEMPTIKEADDGLTDEMKRIQAQNMNLKAQLQAMANENTKLKDDHTKEIATVIESHKMEMLKMSEENKKLKTKLAMYETPPKIFKLDVDCMQEVFDYLSIKEIHSISQTCDRMKRIAGDYYQTNLKALYICSHSDDYDRFWMTFDNKIILNGFAEFVQKLKIDYTISDEGCRFIGENCKSLKKVTLPYRMNIIRVNHLKPILSKIESVTIQTLEGDLYKSFSQLFSNIKHLHIGEDDARKLLLHNYPKIEHLQLRWLSDAEIPELKIFFELNPSLQKLTLEGDELLRNINAMTQSKIKLQVLSVGVTKENEIDVCRHLNELYDQGFYKRLHLIFSAGMDQQSIDRLSSLNRLEKLHIYSIESINLNLFTNLKELSILCNPFNLESTARSLVNLERLSINQIELIETFIQYSANLKAIIIDDSRRDAIDLSALNKKREKLIGARKVIIYLNEEAYLATKWRNKTMEYNMIEAKRYESYDWEFI